ASARRTNIGVRVMPVDAPRLQDAIDVAVVSGAAYVIDDFVAAVLNQRAANFCCERVEHFIPSRSFPLSFAARPDAFQREENAFGIVKLIDRGRTLGAVASARAGMQRIAFEFADLTGVLIDVGEQSASGFTVEAGSWHKRVTPFDFIGPAFGVVFGPIVPAIDRWVACEA